MNWGSVEIYSNNSCGGKSKAVQTGRNNVTLHSSCGGGVDEYVLWEETKTVLGS